MPISSRPKLLAYLKSSNKLHKFWKNPPSPGQGNDLLNRAHGFVGGGTIRPNLTKNIKKMIFCFLPKSRNVVIQAI